MGKQRCSAKISGSRERDYETAILYDEITVSGGRIGSTILLRPEDLLRITHAQLEAITAS